MTTVFHTNDTKNFQHVGGVTIPPGETREVSAALLPDYVAPENALPDVPADPLVTLLTGSVKVISAELETLSDVDLARAAQIEQDGLARKSMLEAFSIETLRRVAKAAGS